MKESKRFIGCTANGYKVFMEENPSQKVLHGKVTPELVAEAIAKIEYVPNRYMGTIEFDRVIGESVVIHSKEDDRIQWVYRPGNDYPSKVAMNRHPEDTNKLTICICKDVSGYDLLYTAYFGERFPKEINDPRLSDEEKPMAESFWNEHCYCIKNE